MRPAGAPRWVWGASAAAAHKGDLMKGEAMTMLSTSRPARGGTVGGRGRQRAPAGRAGVRTAIVASVLLALLVPVNADAS